MRSIESYIKTYSVMPSDFCNRVIAECDDDSFEPHLWGYGETRIPEQELTMSFQKVPSYDAVMQYVWGTIKNYIDDLDSPFLTGWQGFTSVRFNRYEKGKQMLPHVDHINSMFDGERKGVPMLSVVGALNDDYMGGEFVMWDDTEIKLNQGDILVFPSNFLYPHRVNQVTEGVRNTFVSWVW